MVEKSKKRNKGFICEEDISILLERYSVNTVLTLLQEVSKVSGDKIDWNAVAQNTTTGISSARECQMLWRHLAYGQPLIDESDNEVNPMDDDSDLEHEVEAFPALNREASTEAAACVKVLIASECPKDPDLPSNTTIEAPLTINIPIRNNSAGPSEVHGRNICIPVYVQKQPISSGTSGEKRPNNVMSGANYPPRKKKRGWSPEEDMKLTAAVKKHGESKWIDIASEFDDRKASELALRWTTLKKKQGNSKVGTSSINNEAERAAARVAMNMALDMPRSDKWKSALQMSTVGTDSQLQSQKASASTPNQQSTVMGPMKSKMPIRRPFMNPSTINGPDSMVKAAAVAAGARIATPADASSLIEATRSRNVVRISTGAVRKSSSNVQFMRNNLTKAPVSPYSLPSVSRPGEAQKAQGHSMKSAEATVQSRPVGPTSEDKFPGDCLASFDNQPKARVEKHESSSVPPNALRGNLPSSEIAVNGKKSTENLYASKDIHENTVQLKR